MYKIVFINALLGLLIAFACLDIASMVKFGSEHYIEAATK